MRLNEFFTQHNRLVEYKEFNFKDILRVFLPIAKRIIKLDQLPTIILKKAINDGNQPTMGRFDTEAYTIELAVANRHPVDILRTLAHELTHAKQFKDNREMDPQTGSPVENEANTIAGIVIREFNKLHPEFLNAKAMAESIIQVNEGGNVFAGKTARIKREHIQPTLTAYFEELKHLFPKKANIFNSKTFVSLGSVGKTPTSGDIDLGVSAKVLLDHEMSDASITDWGVDPAKVAAEFEQLSKRARTSTPEQLRMKAFLKMLTLKINSAAPSLYCDEKKVTDGNIFGLFPQLNEEGQPIGYGVQIDWMIGDLKWLVFSYHSASYPAGSNIKGLHRTQLMLAAFQIANLSFNHITGVKDKTTGQVVASDPDQALNILSKALGFKISQSDAEDYYKLHKLLKTHLPPERYSHLLNIYFKILDSTRADIPDDMQDEWRARKDSLGLTGKFLPDNSALRTIG